MDPKGAVVPNVPVTITSKATGATLKLTTSSTGTYASGALLPGAYDVRVEAKGFRTEVLSVNVQVGTVTTGNMTLALGEAQQVVKVTTSSVTVNTEQGTVQGVLNAQQIENLPMNGRNFLDLAQLEPGVQIQDGGNFDPTKNGFSSISFGGRFGRTARIEVDGIDISDETVGTTTQNLPASAIQEFQISQSSLDLSTELTSSGAVNVITKSGTNELHGEGFYLFRDHNMAADISDTNLYFQRNNYGGNLGGPILRDKLFFFADVERLQQSLIEPVANQSPAGANFSGLNGSFNSPFRDTNGVARLDWNVNNNYKLIYRFSYEQNSSVKGSIPNSFQPFANVNHTPVHVVGLDFSTGPFTHQVRFGFTKFRNGVTDATQTGVFNPDPQVSLTIGPSVTCLAGGADFFCSGPNIQAPQRTFQENEQIKYDASRIVGAHIIRFGAGYNHIQGGGFAKFFSLAPTVNVNPTNTSVPFFNPANAPFAGGINNPLNYLVGLVLMGNGQGFSTEKPAFGLPAGGLGPDNRLQLYVGDSWKFRTNLTLTYGLRYVHDTGRTDSDLGSINCSALAPALAAPLAAAGTPCTTNILDLWGPGLGKPVRNPALNFAPQFGFAWDPSKSGKMVVRGGIGLYYENSIYNNNLFDRPGRLAQGLFLSEGVPCAKNSPVAGFAMPDGSPVPVNLAAICGQPVGSVSAQLAQLQTAFQSATVKAGPASNAAFIGNTLAAGARINGINMFAPNYQTPRSLQMNIGVERQLFEGVVWKADYIRNVGTHTLLAIDVNHVGDVRFFNKANAAAAIAATNASFGCATVTCAIAQGATIADYANKGLDSGSSACNGGPCPAAAFPGQNPNLGINQMFFPAGHSVYNSFQTSVRANVNNPFIGVKALNLQVSYALSRYLGSALDSDFVNTAVDNNHPLASLGPNGLDRTHQFSFGGSFDLPGNLRLGLVGHVYSPLPLNLTLPPGGIFISDVTGDGSGDGSGSYPVGDLLPGTKLGAFGRSIQPGDLAAFIARYNSTSAGQATPAGQVLINSGLMTLAQLQALGGVLPTLAMPPAGEVGLGWLKTFDLKLSYPKKIGENFSFEPSISFFNLFNNANFDGPNNTLSGVLAGAPGTANGTTAANRVTRILPGSGVFDLGAPRVLELGMKIVF